MQFNFFLSKYMSVNENGITILNGNQKRNPQLDNVITIMGEVSAQAQNLKQVITSPIRFFQTDQKMYIKSEGKVNTQKQFNSNVNYVIYSQYFDNKITNIVNQQQLTQQINQQLQNPYLDNQQKVQQQQTPLKMDLLDQMMQQMTLESKYQYQKSKHTHHGQQIKNNIKQQLDQCQLKFLKDDNTM